MPRSPAVASPHVSLARSLPPVYAVAAVRVASPLVVLPLMAHRLGADEFGRLGLMLVWAGLLSLVVEGGFLAAATRAAVNADAAARRRLARQVFSARCVLSLPVLVAAVAIGGWLVPGGGSVADRWESAALLGVLACALGWPATWYLQATLQLHSWARVEIVVQLLLLGATLTLAHSTVAYLAMQAAAAVALSVLGWAWLRRDLQEDVAAIPPLPPQAPPRTVRRFHLWSAASVEPGLRLGGAMLPVSLLGSAYTLALPALAASQLTRGELGIYYLADRMLRALVAATDPLMQLVYPRIVERFRLGARAAFAYAVRWAAAGTALGLLLVLLAWLAWPVVQGWVRVDAVALRSVCAVLVWLLPLMMGWRYLAYWVLGSGRYDRAYRGCIVAGAVVGLGGALAFGQSPVALALVALGAETAVMLTAGAGVLATEWQRREARA